MAVITRSLRGPHSNLIPYYSIPVHLIVSHTKERKKNTTCFCRLNNVCLAHAQVYPLYCNVAESYLNVCKYAMIYRRPVSGIGSEFYIDWFFSLRWWCCGIFKIPLLNGRINGEGRFYCWIISMAYTSTIYSSEQRLVYLKGSLFSLKAYSTYKWKR